MNDAEHDRLARRAAESMRREARRIAAPESARARLLDEATAETPGLLHVTPDAQRTFARRRPVLEVSAAANQRTGRDSTWRRGAAVAASVAALVVGVVGIASLTSPTPTQDRPAVTSAATASDSTAPVNQAASPEFLATGDQVIEAFSGDVPERSDDLESRTHRARRHRPRGRLHAPIGRPRLRRPA